MTHRVCFLAILIAAVHAGPALACGMRLTGPLDWLLLLLVAAVYYWPVTLALLVVLAMFRGAADARRDRPQVDGAEAARRVRTHSDVAEASLTVIRTRQDVAEASCPVCRNRTSSGVRLCGLCDAPHHDDCFAYNGGCAVFGCKG